MRHRPCRHYPPLSAKNGAVISLIIILCVVALAWQSTWINKNKNKFIYRLLDPRHAEGRRRRQDPYDRLRSLRGTRGRFR